jgi:cyclopropane fatty-acyl-phospholipid synthase-like methyltransferase
MHDISCHGHDLTVRNEFHNGKAQKKAKRWIDRAISSGLRLPMIRAIVAEFSSTVLEPSAVT